jgi:hypothetical protein
LTRYQDALDSPIRADLEKEYILSNRQSESMTKELNSLHREILSEFERRIENDEDIPDATVSALQDEDDLGLESVDIVKTAVEKGITDETE